jgi:hypothetical protein
MQYDLNLNANGAQQIDVAGTYFKYAKGAGPIRVQIDGGGYVDLLPGQGMEGLKFTRLMVKDTSGATNNGALVAGDGRFIDARITGSVEVIDGGKNRTNADLACMGYAYSGPVAGQYTHIQLFNPAGSGKNLYVGQIGFFSTGTVNNGITIGQYNTALPNLVRQGARKRLGATASIAQVNSTNNAAQLLLAASPMAALAKNLPSLKFIEPIEIQPGFGLIVINATTAEDLGATFEYFEEPQ